MNPTGRSALFDEVAKTMHETRVLQPRVIRLAAALGWRHYHPYRSDKSVPGYPDLTMLHVSQQRLLFAELKAHTGRVSPAQVAWLDDLRALTPTVAVEVYVWRPVDLLDGTITRTLTRKEHS